MSEIDPRTQREFARIRVSLRARYQAVNPSRAEEIRDVILQQPSVWAPSVESALRDMATSGAAGSEGVLSRAILELADQVVHLKSLLGESGGPMRPVEVSELSGGGGALILDAVPEQGALMDVRLHDVAEQPPPVRFLAEVVHIQKDNPLRCGIKFVAIHPQDQDRLIRYVYQVQRRALRGSQKDQPES